MKPGTLGCCPGDATVTLVVLNEKGVTVGIVGLKEIFDAVLSGGRSPNAAGVAQRIVTMVRQRNYVSPSSEPQYEAALLREYAKFWATAKDV